MCISNFGFRKITFIWTLPLCMLCCSLIDSVCFNLNTFGILHFTSLPYLTNSYSIVAKQYTCYVCVALVYGNDLIIKT